MIADRSDYLEAQTGRRVDQGARWGAHLFSQSLTPCALILSGRRTNPAAFFLYSGCRSGDDLGRRPVDPFKSAIDVCTGARVDFLAILRANAAARPASSSAT